MGKKKPTFLGALWKIVVEPAWYWLITILPAIFAFVDFFGGGNRIFATVPPQAWMFIAIVAFIFTITISTYRYVVYLDEDTESSKVKSIIRQREPLSGETEIKEFRIDKLRLVDGMLTEAIWREYEEHALTLVNDSGHDIRNCFILLDEVAWNNFENRWEVVAKEVFDQPFKWNREEVVDGKVSISDGERASFVFISHHEYPVYNSAEKRSKPKTDFDFVFSNDEHISIGYGPDLRLLISIRGRNENNESFEPIKYFLYVRLLQLHGIPKVDVIKMKRIKT